MRFPLAALFFLVASFIFFLCWAISTFFLSTVSDGLSIAVPLLSSSSQDSYNAIANLLPWAFGIICAIFFVTGILLIFILDTLADEPEMYWRG